MDGIVIAAASVKDVAIIQQVGRQTFFETFAETNSEEDMQKYLDESFSEEKVLGELNNPGSSFFIARDNDEPVGYLKLNTGDAQTDIKDDAALEIERIYVKAAYHGKRVGQLLYERALEIAQTAGKTYVWLGVWEENQRAIGFYKKNGFEAFGKHAFMLGNDEQTDILMKKIL